MKGLSIVRTCWTPVHEVVGGERISDFSYFFNPLKPHMFGRRWILRGDVFPATGPSDEKGPLPLQSWILDEHGLEPWRRVEGDFLPAVADGVFDDWCELFRLRGPDPDAETFQERFWQAADTQTLPSFLAETTDLAIFGIDGCRWELFAQDESLLQLVEAHVSGLPLVRIGYHASEHSLCETYHSGRNDSESEGEP